MSCRLLVLLRFLVHKLKNSQGIGRMDGGRQDLRLTFLFPFIRARVHAESAYFQFFQDMEDLPPRIVVY